MYVFFYIQKKSYLCERNIKLLLLWKIQQSLFLKGRNMNSLL